MLQRERERERERVGGSRPLPILPKLLHAHEYSLFPLRDSNRTSVEYKSRVLPLQQLSQNLLKCHVAGLNPISIRCLSAKITFLCGFLDIPGESEVFWGGFFCCSEASPSTRSVERLRLPVIICAAH